VLRFEMLGVSKKRLLVADSRSQDRRHTSCRALDCPVILLALEDEKESLLSMQTRTEIQRHFLEEFSLAIQFHLCHERFCWQRTKRE
jgi:hypothetical protein